MTQALPDRTVPDLLDERVAASPEAAAFCCEQADGSWAPVSWHDFHAQAGRLAAGLLAQGLRKGDRLALIAPVSLEWELLHHAALRTGIALQAIGAAMTLFGLVRSQLTNNPLDQFTAISTGLAGIALVLIGLGMYLRHSLVQFLRFWMLRMSYEQAQRPTIGAGQDGER